jgi:hypothetical protein
MRFLLSFFSFIALWAFGLIFLPSSAFSESGSVHEFAQNYVQGSKRSEGEGRRIFEERGDVRVRVRIIQASNVLATASEQLGDQPLQVDSRIGDLTPKLGKLNYANFRLVGFQEKIVPLKKRENIALGGGHLLTLRPLYLEDQRVGMWLRWLDSNGSEILDTRMHFDSNECMLTGTEAKAQTGIILAINASPAE